MDADILELIQRLTTGERTVHIFFHFHPTTLDGPVVTMEIVGPADELIGYPDSFGSEKVQRTEIAYIPVANNGEPRLQRQPGRSSSDISRNTPPGVFGWEYLVGHRGRQIRVNPPHGADAQAIQALAMEIINYTVGAEIGRQSLASQHDVREVHRRQHAVPRPVDGAFIVHVILSVGRIQSLLQQALELPPPPDQPPGPGPGPGPGGPPGQGGSGSGIAGTVA